MTEHILLSTGLLERFFTQRTMPELPVEKRSYEARDWFARLFSEKENLAIRGLNIRTHDPDSEPIGSFPDQVLMGYLLSNRTIFAASSREPHILSMDQILESVMREVVTERTKTMPASSIPLGKLVFLYSEQVQSDAAIFQDLYLGLDDRDSIAQKVRPHKVRELIINPVDHASPAAYEAADTFLRLFPNLNQPNPPVSSVKDLRYLLAANLIHNFTNKPAHKREIANLYLKQEVDAQVKLIYAAMVFQRGYIQSISHLMREIQ